MTQDELEQTLDSLHKSLVDAPQIDANTADKLRVLLQDIQNVLGGSAPLPGSTPLQDTLTQRIKATVADFEFQHPKLTANLSLIAERLADMGI